MFYRTIESSVLVFFFFQAEDGMRDLTVTGVQTCALPIFFGHLRVYVQVAEDGNLIVMHRRSDGRIEVLFPTNPAEDPYVGAGTYEIRAAGDKESFVVSEPEGQGLVVAALAPSGYRFGEFARTAGWNPDALTPSWSGADPVGAVTDIVQR